MKQYKHLGSLIRDSRQLLGISQKELANMFEIKGAAAPVWMNKIESGKLEFPKKKLDRITNILFIPMEEIVEAKLNDYEFNLRSLLGSERRTYIIGEI